MQKTDKDIEFHLPDLSSEYEIPKPDVHSVIIDTSMMAYIDYQGVSTLGTVSLSLIYLLPANHFVLL